MELTETSNINQACIHHKITYLNAFLNLSDDNIDDLKQPAAPGDLKPTDLTAKEKQKVRASIFYTKQDREKTWNDRSVLAETHTG